MQAVEALTRLIAIADRRGIDSDKELAERLKDSDEAAKDQLASSIAQAMLNTALPVARFRCFVQIESGKRKGREFTICAVNIEDIIAALGPLSTTATKVYINLWEQRATGADMLEGYQGWTRTATDKKMQMFLKSLEKYSSMGTAN